MLGFLALFVAIPPLTIRSPVPTVVLALAGMVCGFWAAPLGEKRVGWGAVFAVASSASPSASPPPSRA